MNILVVVHYHFLGINVPTALFVHEQMRAFVRAGHRVRALVPIARGKRGEDGRRFGPALLRMDVDGIEHMFLRIWSFSNYGRRGLNLRCAKAALRKHMDEILENFKPDVIHAHKLGGNTELGALLRERAGCPLVFTSHGETGVEEPWISDPARGKPFADKGDAIVCVGSPIQRALEGWGVKVPLFTISNGYSHDKMREEIVKRPHSMIQVGRINMQKRVFVTLDAFRLLREKAPDMTLAFVGWGDKEDALKKRCADYGLENAVRFTGQLPNKEALSEMAKAQFFVMPSVHEGFGVVYLEAMANGCVTIGTEGEGIADLIVSGENGFLVPPDDPEAIAEVISWCMEHPEEAARIAERGQRDAQGLTWDKNAARYIQLFEALKGGRAECG